MKKRKFKADHKLGVVDLQGDKINTHAITQENLDNMSKIITYDFDLNNPIGHCTKIKKEGDIIKIEGEITSDEMWDYIQKKIIEGIGIGGRVLDKKFDKNENVMEIKDMEIHQFSLVKIPAHPDWVIEVEEELDDFILDDDE